MKGIQRTNDKNDPRDFYQTPEIAIQAMLPFFAIKSREYFDPCAGNKPIEKVFRENGYSSFLSRDKVYDGYDFLKDENHYDAIIMNPPFNQKYKFLDHAFSHAKRTIVILPMLTVNYHIMITRYLSRPDFLGKLVMAPKFYMTENYQVGIEKCGGSTAYAWFCWDNMEENSPEDPSLEWYCDLRKMQK